MRKCSRKDCIHGGVYQPLCNFHIRSGEKHHRQCADCTRAYAQSKPGRINKMLVNARARAKKAGVPCTIVGKDFTVPARCPMLGIRLVHGAGETTDASPTLDRILPTLGYVPGNVLVMSQKANRIKTNANWKEILKVGVALRNLVGE